MMNSTTIVGRWVREEDNLKWKVLVINPTTRQSMKKEGGEP
jgi:hypothetical protein